MESLKDLVARLYPFEYSITGPGNDAAVSVMREYLDFEVFEWSSGSQLNGWIVPPAHFVECALLMHEGRVVYDGKLSPLGVWAQSESFSGTLTLEELQPHLFSLPSLPDAVPAHWSRLYRPDASVWGFCIPHRIRETLKPGRYEVRLVTRVEPSAMKVLLFTLPGKSRESFLFDAHNCHPFQANDDMSGVAVGIQLMRSLAATPNRHYTYQLLVAPELFGPAFWIDGMSDDDAAQLCGTVMLKSVGNARALRLQRAFNEESLISRASMYVFRSKYGTFDSGVFRGVYGNDETIFEAPPFKIPSITFTRWPFREYHTDLDTPSRLSEEHLQDCLDTALRLCRVLEMSRTFKPAFRGLVSLSRHNLYLPIPDVGADGVDFDCEQGRWHRLMNTLPSLLGHGFDLLTVAQDFNLPAEDIYAYLMRWANAGLVEVL
jgi:aminopeptidase-like protein